MAHFQGERVTIREIARRAGISVSTVSRYLNQSGYVEQETAKRIAEAIEKTNYTPSIAARSLKTRKSQIVLLVVPDICNPFYSGIAKTVQQLVRERGYVMALYDSDESEQELPSVGIAKQMYAAGILMGSIDIKPEVIKALVRSNIPVVGLNAYQAYPFDTVHVQGSDGSYLATQHLIQLGHRHIGFAGGTPGSMIANSRRDGYRRAMKEANLDMDPQDIIEKGFSQNDGYEMGQYFMKLNTLPTAICCANDQIALGLLSVLHEQGIPIPERVSVTGMDDIPYAQISNPSLTSVTNDPVAFSYEGVKMLFDRINGNEPRTPRNVAIPHQLVVRNSTGAPPAQP